MSAIAMCFGELTNSESYAIREFCQLIDCVEGGTSKADSEGYVRFLGLPEGTLPFSAAAEGRRWETLLIDTTSQCEGTYDIV
jgi:hypothetical protein